jgi:hypothetical protein
MISSALRVYPSSPQLLQVSAGICPRGTEEAKCEFCCSMVFSMPETCISFSIARQFHHHRASTSFGFSNPHQQFARSASDFEKQLSFPAWAEAGSKKYRALGCFSR